MKRDGDPTCHASGIPGSLLTTFVLALFTGLCALHPYTASAQTLPDDPESQDPIGGDDEAVNQALTAHSAEDAAARARFGPPAPAREVRAGEVLSAIAGVRETQHREEVAISGGLAQVNVTMRFANASSTRAEVQYRLSVPEGAALDALEVCEGTHCQSGLVETLRPAGLSAYDDAVRARGPHSEALPIAHARIMRDERGNCIVVRAAPVAEHRDVVVRVRYLVDAPLAGGVVHLVLPARGTDPRAAPAEVALTAPGFISPSIDAQPAESYRSRIEAWYPIALNAMLATRAPLTITATNFACGNDECLRVHAMAGTRNASPADIVLLIDASPSTEGPARGRIAPTIAAVLSNAPVGSTVRAIAFGAHAQGVLETRHAVESAPIVPLAQAPLLSLGSSTRLESAWASVRAWMREPLSAHATRRMLVLIGDGGLSIGQDSERAIAEIRRARVPFHVINVDERQANARLRELAEATRGQLIQAGAQAEQAVRGQSDSELSARVSAIFAETLFDSTALPVGTRARVSALRAGEEITWEGRVARSPRSLSWLGMRTVVARSESPALAQRVTHANESALVAVSRNDFNTPRDTTSCDVRGPARRESGVNSDASPIALVAARSCIVASTSAAASTTEEDPRARLQGRGVPRETVLFMLRQRIIPAARACFRQDRRGRGDYTARAEYTFTLADREIVSVDIQGSIAEPLRLCLRDAIDTLDVPRFSGTVVVRYPIRTEAAEPEPVLELAPEVAREIDAHFHDREGVDSFH